MAIECCYGILKRRFPILKNVIKFRALKDSANMVIAAVIIHNFCVKSRENEDEIIEAEDAIIEAEEFFEQEVDIVNSKRDSIAEIL